MPSCNYEGFNVNVESSPGVIESVAAGVLVVIYNVTGGADITSVNTDSNGDIPADSCTGLPGDILRFRVENYQGMAFSTAQIAT